VLLVALLRLSN